MMDRISRLRGLFRSARAEQKTPLPSYIDVNGTRLTQLEPLGGIFKPGVTKAGRLSLSGMTPDGKKVKVYGAYNPAQVALRQDMEVAQVSSEIHFPKLLLNNNSIIVEEWIDGTPLNKLPAEKVKDYEVSVEAFLESLQNDPSLVALSAKHSDSFCYLSNYLISRLETWEQWQPVKTLMTEWRKAKDAVSETLPNRLSHPDLSLLNLILERDTGKLYVIDNELFGVGQGWVIDGQNTFCKERFTWEKLSNEEQLFASLSWKLRLVGSSLDAGDFPRAMRRAQI